MAKTATKATGTSKKTKAASAKTKSPAVTKSVPTKTVINRSYFLTYLLPAGYTESELVTFKEQIATLVTKHQGKVTNTDEWGKRKMAYQIKHSGKWHTEANYVHLTINMNPAEAQPLERDIHLNVNVIRHLLVVTESKTAE